MHPGGRTYSRLQMGGYTLSASDTRLPIEHLRNANPAWIRKNMGNLDTLAQSMNGKGKLGGQLMPVLVDPSYRVIDGARRIEAATKLGWSEVSVLCTADFTVITEQMQATKPSAMPMSWLETMELIALLREIYLPISRQQAVITKQLGLKTVRGGNSGIGLALPRAIGMPKKVLVELSRAWSMINDQATYSPAARERMRAVVPEVEVKGQPYGLIATMKRAAYLSTPKVSDKSLIKDQRLAFTGAIAGLQGTVLALPPPDSLDPGHDREELVAWDKSITDILQRIYTVRKEIRKQYKQNVTEGDREPK